MMVYYITFRSVTAAQRGERVLQTAGVRPVLLRTPKWMESQGCGYSLRIRTDELWPVVSMLREKSIAFRRIYVQTADGTLEEVAV